MELDLDFGPSTTSSSSVDPIIASAPIFNREMANDPNFNRDEAWQQYTDWWAGLPAEFYDNPQYLQLALQVLWGGMDLFGSDAMPAYGWGISSHRDAASMNMVRTIQAATNVLIVDGQFGGYTLGAMQALGYCNPNGKGGYYAVGQGAIRALQRFMASDTYRLISILKNELGTKEGKNGYTKYGAWYRTQPGGYPGVEYSAWCDMFVSWCANNAGMDSVPINCNCPQSVNDYGDRFMLRASGYIPKPGDQIFFDGAKHTGAVIGYNPITQTVCVIHGNTSQNNVGTLSISLNSTYIYGYGINWGY